MKKTLIHSQISNAKTVQAYMRRLTTLAENVFDFENLPPFIDNAYMNKRLLRDGAIAFFEDDVLGVLALPFTVNGDLDVYSRPLSITVYGQNGYTKNLTNDKFVIMYDNNGRYSLMFEIRQFAERLALAKRVTDINILQQKTPRIWKTSNENKKTITDMINNIDACLDTVQTYETMELDNLDVCVAPAPYVTDKIDEHMLKEWAEFYQLIGISSIVEQKKERLIKDEMQASLGGTIASRFSRYNPRLKAIKEINEKWGLDIKLKYYDGLPNMIEEKVEEVGENVF